MAGSEWWRYEAADTSKKTFDLIIPTNRPGEDGQYLKAKYGKFGQYYTASGVVVQRTGGLRKGRLAKNGTGKSGGFRLFSFYLDSTMPVFLLWILDKADAANLTDAQEQAFKLLTAELKKELAR